MVKDASSKFYTTKVNPNNPFNQGQITQNAIAGDDIYPEWKASKEAHLELIDAQIVNTGGGLFIPLIQKGANNGVATLDAVGKVPLSQMPFSNPLQFKGSFDPNIGYPIIPAPANIGWFYIASASGTAGGTFYEIGDWAVSDGTQMIKVEANEDDLTNVWFVDGNALVSGIGNINHPFNKVQQALDNPNLQPNDVIFVMPNTYNENITINNPVNIKAFAGNNNLNALNGSANVYSITTIINGDVTINASDVNFNLIKIVGNVIHNNNNLAQYDNCEIEGDVTIDSTGSQVFMFANYTKFNNIIGTGNDNHITFNNSFIDGDITGDIFECNFSNSSTTGNINVNVFAGNICNLIVSQIQGAITGFLSLVCTNCGIDTLNTTGITMPDNSFLLIQNCPFVYQISCGDNCTCNVLWSQIPDTATFGDSNTILFASSSIQGAITCGAIGGTLSHFSSYFNRATLIIGGYTEILLQIARMISYDNSVSGLVATNVQDAIDEVAGAGGGGVWTDITSFAQLQIEVANGKNLFVLSAQITFTADLTFNPNTIIIGNGFDTVNGTYWNINLADFKIFHNGITFKFIDFYDLPTVTNPNTKIAINQTGSNPAIFEDITLYIDTSEISFTGSYIFSDTNNSSDRTLENKVDGFYYNYSFGGFANITLFNGKNLKINNVYVNNSFGNIINLILVYCNGGNTKLTVTNCNAKNALTHNDAIYASNTYFKLNNVNRFNVHYVGGFFSGNCEISQLFSTIVNIDGAGKCEMNNSMILDNSTQNATWTISPDIEMYAKFINFNNPASQSRTLTINNSGYFIGLNMYGNLIIRGTPAGINNLHLTDIQVCGDAGVGIPAFMLVDTNGATTIKNLYLTNINIIDYVANSATLTIGDNTNPINGNIFINGLNTEYVQFLTVTDKIEINNFKINSGLSINNSGDIDFNNGDLNQPFTLNNQMNDIKFSNVNFTGNFTFANNLNTNGILFSQCNFNGQFIFANNVILDGKINNCMWVNCKFADTIDFNTHEALIEDLLFDNCYIIGEIKIGNTTATDTNIFNIRFNNSDISNNINFNGNNGQVENIEFNNCNIGNDINFTNSLNAEIYNIKIMNNNIIGNIIFANDTQIVNNVNIGNNNITGNIQLNAVGIAINEVYNIHHNTVNGISTLNQAQYTDLFINYNDIVGNLSIRPNALGGFFTNLNILGNIIVGGNLILDCTIDNIVNVIASNNNINGQFTTISVVAVSAMSGIAIGNFATGGYAITIGATTQFEVYLLSTLAPAAPAIALNL